MIKTKASWVRLAGLGGLCLALWACGGEDSGSNSADNGSDNGSENDDADSDFDDFNSDQQHSNQEEPSAESECSGSSECEFIVCDCAEGPVNFQGCNVVNGVGTCATESTCSSAFGACD